MEKKFGKIEKLRVVAYLLMVVFFLKIVAWIEPDTLKKKVSGGIEESARDFIIHIMKESNVKISYLFYDNSNMVEKIASNINETNNVYRLVEYHYSKENLVAYAPGSKYAKYVADSGGKENLGDVSHSGNLGDGNNPEEIQNGSESGENTTNADEQTAEGSGNTDPGQMLAEGESAGGAGENVQETFAPVFSVEQLKDYDFLRSNLYIVPDRAKVLPEDLDASVLLGTDLSIAKNPLVPQILIYHTHGSEGFADSTENLAETGIIAAGTKLAQELADVYGYNVIHCTEVFDNVNGVFDRSKAYDYSRAAVQQILTDNPSIQVIIDLHRDGVREDLHLVTEVNGKPTAQIMFFNGVSRSSAKGDLAYLYNRYRSENLAFSLQAKLEALGRYPDFTRKNYIDAYQYNLDLMPRAMLIEAGAQTNTLEEELNAMEPLADILDRVLSGKNKEHLY